MKFLTRQTRGKVPLFYKVKFIVLIIVIGMVTFYYRNPVALFEHSLKLNKYSTVRARQKRNEFIRVKFGDIAYQWKTGGDEWYDLGKAFHDFGTDFVGFFACVFNGGK